MIARTVFGILLAAMFGSGQTSDGLPKFDSISIKTAGPQVSGQPVVESEGSAQQGLSPGSAEVWPAFWCSCTGWRSIRSLYLSGCTMSPGPYSYNISVTMPPDTSDRQIQSMMQNLLAERFHLVFHHETRNFPGYELVVADGRPLMKETATG
jgi:uncharacterized protein (TIGR03435 family)